jgi:hypothetical protein
MNSGHKIKYRSVHQDKFYTPIELASFLVPLVPIEETDTLFDPFKGKGAFFNCFPKGHDRGWAEIDEGRNFFDYIGTWDWLISNPPYSCLDDVLGKSCMVAQKGFAYLLLGHALTPRRLEMIERLGFGLTKIHMSKVFKWYGISMFCVFEKGKKHIIDFDRKVWK